MASEEGGWGKTERSGWIRFDSIRFRFDSNRLSFPRTRLPTERGGGQDVVGASPCRGGRRSGWGRLGFLVGVEEMTTTLEYESYVN